MLSDDWTKSLHLQTDRTVQLQAQGGAHARVRIPKFGRALGYHFPSADAVVAAAGREVYRLNLDQGRFLAPFVLGGGDLGEPAGCNAIDVNPAHGLLCFGTEGTGVVEMWDSRMRKRAGVLSVATETVLDAALLVARRNLPGVLDDADDMSATKEALASLSVTALAGAEDGLNLAVGTNTGHVLLYDLRMDRPYQTKDQGFGLPIKKLMWPGDKAAANTGGSGPRTRSEAEGKVLSADAKVIKIWDKDSGDNLVSVTPPSAATDINDVAHYPGTGLLMAAVEGTQMAAWYVPALGPAPRWCSYIDTLTDEMDGVDTGGAGAGKGVYEDFKFVDRAELERLSMSHLIGTQLLRPYMHGYFVSLALYERARLLNNPTAYADARERAIKAKLEKQAESRIRAIKNPKLDAGVRVNKELAEKVARDAQAAAKKQAKRDAKAAAAAAEGDAETPEVDGEAAKSLDKPGAANLLSDSRFTQLFQDPDFQIDTSSREFAMLNPSTALKTARDGPRKLTAVEDEENESDRESVDPDMESDASSSDDDNNDGQGGDSGDSSDEGDLGQYDPRARDASGKRPKNLNQAPDVRARQRGARTVRVWSTTTTTDPGVQAARSAASRRGSRRPALVRLAAHVRPTLWTMDRRPPVQGSSHGHPHRDAETPKRERSLAAPRRRREKRRSGSASARAPVPPRARVSRRSRTRPGSVARSEDTRTARLPRTSSCAGHRPGPEIASCSPCRDTCNCTNHHPFMPVHRGISC